MQAFAKLPATVKPGVVTGKALTDLLDNAKAQGYAIEIESRVLTKVS